MAVPPEKDQPNHDEVGGGNNSEEQEEVHHYLLSIQGFLSFRTLM
jgi:hypothetical protein